jgi:hypothetical protein
LVGVEFLTDGSGGLALQDGLKLVEGQGQVVTLLKELPPLADVALQECLVLLVGQHTLSDHTFFLNKKAMEWSLHLMRQRITFLHLNQNQYTCFCR